MIRFAAMVLLCSLTPAQDLQPAQIKIPTKAEWKNKAPVSKETLQVKLPLAREYTLENGLTVFILEDHRLPEVSVQVEVRGAGSIFDPQGMTGLASATAGMLSRGTATRSVEQIAKDLDLLSADISAFANLDATAVFQMSGLTENFDRWFDLGVDELLHPAFPAEEWNKLKRQRIANMQRNRGNANFLAAERFNPIVFGGHPAGAIATPASIEAITVESIKRWYAERYAPQNSILGIAGDVIPSKLLPRLKMALASWKRNDYQVPPLTSPAAAQESHIVVVNRPGALQTNLLIGNIGISRKDPDYEPVQVLSSVFYEALWRNLRTQHSVYTFTHAFNANEIAGDWYIEVPCQTEVTGVILGEIFSEIRQIRGDQSRDEERAADILQVKKQLIVGSFAFSLENPKELLQDSMDRKTYHLPEDYWDTYTKRIAAVSAEDLRRVARKYLNPDTLQIVAVGDASKIRSVVEKYGHAVVYDVSGNLLP